MEQYKRGEDYKIEIIRALRECGVNPYQECHVDGAADYLKLHQNDDQPADMWAVIMQFKRESAFLRDAEERRRKGSCNV